MRKKIVVCFVIFIVVLSCGQAFASEYDIMPIYNVVSAVNTSISSTDDGVNMKIWVCAPNSTALDKVVVTVDLKRVSGVTAASYTQNLTKQANVFIFDKTANVNVSGTYVFEYTAKCYKSNVLVDTITGTSTSAYHTV